MTLIRAIAFAAKEHEGQFRLDGTEPYIVHPIRVAEHAELAGLAPAAVIAAVLHDVIEDCRHPERNAAFIQKVWPASWPLVDLLTKKGDDKGPYYAAILENLTAIALKLLDRGDNMEDMFRMLRSTSRPDTKKGNLRWAQSYLRKTVIEIDPLAEKCENTYAIDIYMRSKTRLSNIVASVEA